MLYKTSDTTLENKISANIELVNDTMINAKDFI